MLQSLHHWRYYSLSKEFVLYFDHKALHYFHFHSKLSSRHVEWVEFLQNYTFILKHNDGIDNNIADAFRHVISILHSMQNSVTGFDYLKDKYPQCPDVGIIYKESLDNPSPTQGDFLIREGYLFKGV